MICDNLTVNQRGHLCLAGWDTVDLAKKYGTPLYLYDEGHIRARARLYQQAAKEAFGKNTRVLYASKAACFKALLEVMKEENMGIDVVSSGEIATAIAAGFPLERAYFHSNNKTDEDVRFAIENGIGAFVVDNAEELYAIEREAAKQGITQKVLLRLTPGIDPHTYAAVATGQVDSKFGSAIETGQAEEITRLAISPAFPHIHLAGFHCHVGSQVFEADVFLKAVDIMLAFIAHIQSECGYEIEELDLGGGYGVRYTEADPALSIAENIKEVGKCAKERARALGITLPTILLEPGRSMVADAGMTLYTVGTVKRITGYKNYVSVDGGMTDNPRYALYRSAYTLLPADNMKAEREMRASVVGRCCESGDILQENVPLPDSISRGNILACLTTGAYNYSMAMNYNRIPRPAVVFLTEKDTRLVVKRETLSDLLRLDT
ncbi:MAG: diaminopimelate decarboxylase [Clostridia bacterium]|nr:diaminopimelate decarboxylase [Clostridia bacterium]